MKIKLTVAALCVAFTTQTALAGSLADPVIEAPVIVADTTNNSSGAAFVLALALLLAIPVID